MSERDTRHGQEGRTDRLLSDAARDELEALGLLDGDRARWVEGLGPVAGRPAPCRCARRSCRRCVEVPVLRLSVSPGRPLTPVHEVCGKDGVRCEVCGPQCVQC